MGDEADADWQAGLFEWGIEDVMRTSPRLMRSWYCDQCAVEVYDRVCKHCGKSRRQRR